MTEKITGRMRRYYELVERVGQLAKDGKTDEEIALEVSRSVSRVRVLRTTAGIKRPPYARPPQELIDKIHHLSAEEGWPPVEICDTLGVSRQTAYIFGVRGPGDEWNKVARWASRWHRELWEELRA